MQAPPRKKEASPKENKLTRDKDNDLLKIEEFTLSTAKVSEKDFLPLQQLGRGSFGDVYLVRDLFPGSGRLFAMKILNKRTKQEESWLRYIKTERDVLATSTNPFIVKLHYAFQTQKKLFLVIDFCPGGDLETMIHENKGPFTEDKAKFIAAEILLAIKDLHERNVIYRDLKPDNVVIDNDGHMQLIDFGMAKTNITLA